MDPQQTESERGRESEGEGEEKDRERRDPLLGQEGAGIRLVSTAWPKMFQPAQGVLILTAGLDATVVPRPNDVCSSIT